MKSIWKLAGVAVLVAMGACKNASADPTLEQDELLILSGQTQPKAKILLGNYGMSTFQSDVRHPCRPSVSYSPDSPEMTRFGRYYVIDFTRINDMEFNERAEHKDTDFLTGVKGDAKYLSDASHWYYFGKGIRQVPAGQAICTDFNCSGQYDDFWFWYESKTLSAQKLTEAFHRIKKQCPDYK